jgi:hypothetical protein
MICMQGKEAWVCFDALVVDDDPGQMALFDQHVLRCELADKCLCFRGAGGGGGGDPMG